MSWVMPPGMALRARSARAADAGCFARYSSRMVMRCLPSLMAVTGTMNAEGLIVVAGTHAERLVIVAGMMAAEGLVPVEEAMVAVETASAAEARRMRRRHDHRRGAPRSCQNPRRGAAGARTPDARRGRWRQPSPPGAGRGRPRLRHRRTPR